MMGSSLRERVEKEDENEGLRKEGRSSGVGVQAGVNNEWCSLAPRGSPGASMADRIELLIGNM